jgi:hypothetical protein
MSRRFLLGTDWYMTKISGLSGRQFWRRLLEGFQPKERRHLPNGELVRHCLADPRFRAWGQFNTLRFLNLHGPKRSERKSRMEYMEEAYRSFHAGRPPSDYLPPWWAALKRRYENGL